MSNHRATTNGRCSATVSGRTSAAPVLLPGHSIDEYRRAILRDNLALMWAVLRRENAALRELFERYSGYVFGICVRMLGDRAEAEEVMADTFWELWKKPERFDPTRGSIVTYLVMVARSRAIDHLRRRADARLVSLEAFESSASAVSPARERSSAPPLESMLLDEQRKKVAGLIEELNEKQREAIELCFFHGLSHQQAAETLGEPLGTVKTRIRKGLMRLREGLCHPEVEGVA